MATLDRLSPPTTATPTASTWPPRRAIAVVLACAAAIALLQVLQSSSFTHTGRELQRLERERTVLAAQVHQLEADVAALSSLERTERAARERLGMVPATRIEHITVAEALPSGPLLPRPLLSPGEAQRDEREERWWQSFLKALPFR
jgi:cell division protein FtsL